MAARRRGKTRPPAGRGATAPAARIRIPTARTDGRPPTGPASPPGTPTIWGPEAVQTALPAATSCRGPPIRGGGIDKEETDAHVAADAAGNLDSPRGRSRVQRRLAGPAPGRAARP